MKALFLAIAMLASASIGAAQPQLDLASSEAEQNNEIVVEAQRLTEELKGTTLTLVRGRNNRATFKLRANGTFVSAMNGLQSDFGEWWVEGDTVCFDGRMLDTFCSVSLAGKRPGDTWVGSGYDGKRWEASLAADD
jgi:heat shock protein HslJ